MSEIDKNKTDYDNVNEKYYNKYKSAKTAHNYVFDMLEKKSSIFKSESYILWKINKNWEKIVGKLISDSSEPKYLKNGNLIINIGDSTIYQTILISQNEVIKKINDFLELKLVNKLEIKKVNLTIRRNITDEIVKVVEDKKNTNELSINKLKLNIQKESNKYTEQDVNVIILEKEKKTIEENISKIDKKYYDFAKKLEEIAINRLKKDKYLLQNGYITCSECGSIFYPGKNEKICFECYEKKEQQKENYMLELIKQNPYIGEKDAVLLTKTDDYIYYKIRDILSERIFRELIDFSEKMNIELEVNIDYNHEIKEEAKIEFEKLVKLYINYRVGSDNPDVYIHERKKLLRRLRNTMRYRKRG